MPTSSATTVTTTKRRAARGWRPIGLELTGPEARRSRLARYGIHRVRPEPSTDLRLVRAIQMNSGESVGAFLGEPARGHPYFAHRFTELARHPPGPTENRAIHRPRTRGAAGQTRRSCRSSGAPVLCCEGPRNPDSISTSAELVVASPVRLAAVIRAIATSFGLIGHRSAALPGGSAKAQVTYWPVG